MGESNEKKSRHLHLSPAGDTKVEDLKSSEQNKGANARLKPPELLSDESDMEIKKERWI